MKEALARIKINKLLEAAGWRFFPDAKGPANIRLEPSVIIKVADLDALGDNFEKTEKGFIDYLLLNEKAYPFIVLEAKAEDKDPLDGKEQARKYARSQNCRIVLLSNGNLHYLWDLDRGNPYVITTFPTPTSALHYEKVVPDPKRLIAESVGRDYIALTQRPTYAADAGWKSEVERPEYIRVNKLRFLREYQQRAVQAIQRAVKDGKDRFLFEMATGTGKTLLAAAVIKLFLRTANAGRVLFLVDRLELEEQARKNFVAYLKNDFQTVVYKENRDDWRKAEIVVSTVQSLLFSNKYQQRFSPTDFDLVISDEAHRSIGGNARAVFDYFIGYKLGLTATPRDFLKNFDKANPTTRDPREQERRLLLDTYRTFGCENSQPTFRYSLVDGVNDPEGPFLVNPQGLPEDNQRVRLRPLRASRRCIRISAFSTWVSRGRRAVPHAAKHHRFHRVYRGPEKERNCSRPRLIDGARAVLEHYRPHIPLSRAGDNGSRELWPRVRLGEVMERFNEIIHPGDRKSGELTFVGMEHIEEGTGRRIGSIQVDLGRMTGRKPTFKKGQIVYGYLRPYLNKVWIAEFDGCSSVDQFAFEVDTNAVKTMSALALWQPSDDPGDSYISFKRLYESLARTFTEASGRPFDLYRVEHVFWFVGEHPFED
jgi:hypothetical protein